MNRFMREIEMELRELLNLNPPGGQARQADKHCYPKPETLKKGPSCQPASF